MGHSSQRRVLDVRPLIARGEEPFPVIRQKIDLISNGETLEVVAPFLPSPLIELLKSEGFSVSMEHCSDGSWRVVFGRS